MVGHTTGEPARSCSMHNTREQTSATATQCSQSKKLLSLYLFGQYTTRTSATALGVLPRFWKVIKFRLRIGE